MGPVSSVDAIVLGAGIAGLTAAYELSRAGQSVHVVESYPNAGGNHRSLELGDMTFDIGAIFFWSHMPIFEMFPALRENCVPVPWRTERISPDSGVRPYPFDVRSELLGRSPRFIAAAACSLLKARLAGLKRSSADDFLRYYLGEEIRRVSGIDDFIRRFYGLSPEQISFAFASQRMQQIARGTQVATRLRDLAGLLGRRMVPALPDTPVALARPKQGFAAHYMPAISQLEDAGVKFSLDAGDYSISGGRSGFRVTSRVGAVRGARLISTIPVEHLAAKLGLDVEAMPQSLSLTTLCCRFEGARGFDGTVLYNFNRSGRWKRLTIHSDYYGRTAEGAEYFCLEAVTDRDSAARPDELFDDFRVFADGHDIFRGRLEHVDTMQTDFAYPLYDLDVEARRAAIISTLSDMGIELMGRQGRFQYHPTSGNTVMDVRARLAAHQ